MAKLKPIHPGEILMEEFLKPLNVSQYRLAVDIDVSPRRINEIVLGKRGKRHYIAGIHAAMGHDYSTLIGMFRRVIDRTWKRVSSNNR